MNWKLSDLIVGNIEGGQIGNIGFLDQVSEPFVSDQVTIQMEWNEFAQVIESYKLDLEKSIFFVYWVMYTSTNVEAIVIVLTLMKKFS